MWPWAEISERVSPAFLADGDHDWYVLEVSSFMLDDTATFQAIHRHAAEHHPTTWIGMHTKWKTMLRANSASLPTRTNQIFFIYNADDPVIREG